MSAASAHADPSDPNSPTNAANRAIDDEQYGEGVCTIMRNNPTDAGADQAINYLMARFSTQLAVGIMTAVTDNVCPDVKPVLQHRLMEDQRQRDGEAQESPGDGPCLPGGYTGNGDSCSPGMENWEYIHRVYGASPAV
ncbi:hypothetical protein ABIA30_002949 [Mycobacterium sp. MAA66]|uniref:hypothetical protein n=1 Tax=Mycobacterium sp. MAA66 TaxID=3156297 RepID=UPI003518F9A1